MDRLKIIESEELNLLERIIRSLAPEEELKRLWDDYQRCQYAKYVYAIRCAKEHRDSLIEKFILDKEGRYLEIGCGPGVLFEPIAKIIQPKELHAIDYSLEMRRGAEKEAKKLEKIYRTKFFIYDGDLSKSETWHVLWQDDYFDGVISNMFLNYVAGGWEPIIQQEARILKPGGIIYGGPLIDGKFYKKALRHALPEFIRQPRESFRGLKFRKKISKISKRSQELEAKAPVKEELIKYLKELGFTEIETTETYWGLGMTFRARLKPF